MDTKFTFEVSCAKNNETGRYSVSLSTTEPGEPKKKLWETPFILSRESAKFEVRSAVNLLCGGLFSDEGYMA